MGLRFRRSLKLAPGLRLNLSGSGVSLSAGPRGASVNFGSRGTYFNAGIPGTGLYARERLSSGTTSRAEPTPQTVRVTVKIEVDMDGNIAFKDSNGDPVSEYLITKAKREHGPAIRDLIENCCEKINASAKAVAEIHLQTPAPTARIVFKPRAFDVPVPLPPIPKLPGFLDRLFKSRAARIEEQNQQAVHMYEGAVRDRKAKADAFAIAEAERREFLEQRVFADPGAMEKHLTQAFEDIAWPRETNVSFEIQEGGKVIAIDVDLPEVEDLPTRIAFLPSTGYKVKFRRHRKVRFRRHTPPMSTVLDFA
jgi:uncharacterized protein DUF4236